MIEREHQSLSVSRQCRLLGVSRSTLYYRPVGESAATLELMRRIDELYLQYPFYGSRQMVRHLAREGVAVGRHRVRRLMRLLGLEAIYRKPRTSVSRHIHIAWVCISEGGRGVGEAEIELHRRLAELMPVLGVITKARSDRGFRAEVQALLTGSRGCRPRARCRNASPPPPR